MKKSIRNFLLIILSTLLLCTSVLVIFPFSKQSVKAEAKADENGIFEFLNGVSVGGDADESEDVGLRFRINLLNMAYDDLEARIGNYYWTNFLGYSELKDDIYYENILTVNRVNKDGSETALCQIVINFTLYIYQGEVVFQRTYWFKKLAYTEQLFNIETWDKNRSNELLCNTIAGHDELNKRYFDNGYERLDDAELCSADSWLFYDSTNGTSVPYWDVCLTGVSPFTRYNVEYKYNFNEFHRTTTVDLYKTTSGGIKSRSDSVFDVLTRINDAGDFEKLPESQKVLFEPILDAGYTEEVTVAYLTPIKGTPFATRVTAKVEVPVYKNAVDLDDVYASLNVDNVDIYDAHVSGFYEKDGIYVAQYYKSFWLKATTPDGHQFNYFNDFNKSYKEYYYQYVEDGVIDSGVYEYIFNSMLVRYPELAPYQTTPENVYGLWGMAVLPETYSIDSFWKDLFSTSTTKGEHISMFSQKKQLSISQYNALLQTYEYNWLDTVWANLGGFVEGMYCYNYLFYAEPGTEISWLDLTGQTKDEEDVTDTPNNPGIVGGVIGDITTDAGNILGGIYDVTIGSLAKANGWVSILVIAGIGIVVVLIYVKLKGKSKRK